MALTPGLLKAITKGGTYSVCQCGFPLPKYPGRYPKTCPQCGKPVKPAAAEPPPEPEPVVSAAEAWLEQLGE
jgi:hypothetical protein